MPVKGFGVVESRTGLQMDFSTWTEDSTTRFTAYLYEFVSVQTFMMQI